MEGINTKASKKVTDADISLAPHPVKQNTESVHVMNSTDFSLDYMTVSLVTKKNKEKRFFFSSVVECNTGSLSVVLIAEIEMSFSMINCESVQI